MVNRGIMQALLSKVGFAVFVLALSSGLRANDDQPEVLTVDNAVKIALANNRMLKITSLKLADTQQEYLAFKTHRYPSFQTFIFASELLAPISFTVPAGQFGTYPGIGPIPATNTPITTPQQPTAYVMANVTQPLFTLYKINIALQGKGLEVDKAAQDYEGKKISVVANVRETYYTALQVEDSISATEASIKAYEELERISTQ